jgi:hypothetical protein
MGAVALNRNGLLKRKRYGTGELSHREAVLRLLIDVRKAAACQDCGEHFPTCCMDLDHRPEVTKTRSVSEMVRRKVPVLEVVAEMNKCDVVCSKCHRIRTRERKLEWNP